MSHDPFTSPTFSDEPQNPFASPQVDSIRDVNEGLLGKTVVDWELNPWTDIWSKPRAVIRQLIDAPERAQVWTLAAIGGISTGLTQFLDSIDNWLPDALALDVPARAGYFVGSLLGASIVGVIMGLISVAIGGWLLSVVGKMLGGIGSVADLRVASAYSYIPSIWLIPLTAAAIFIAMFAELGPTLGVVLILMGVTMIVVGIWQFVIGCRAIGEAHQFSGWRGLGTAVLAIVLVVGLLFVAVLPFVVFFSV